MTIRRGHLSRRISMMTLSLESVSPSHGSRKDATCAHILSGAPAPGSTTDSGNGRVRIIILSSASPARYRLSKSVHSLRTLKARTTRIAQRPPPSRSSRVITAVIPSTSENQRWKPSVHFWSKADSGHCQVRPQLRCHRHSIRTNVGTGHTLPCFR